MSKIVSGFTFIKNGLSLAYPFKEAIESISPLCDEVIINVGFEDEALTKDDGTYEFLRDELTSSKYRFIKNFWDPNIRKHGQILADHTNLALNECKGRICQYIQGDEAIHEDDLSILEKEYKILDDRNDIEGLVFNYLHFYGNVDTYRHARNVYRREVRTIKNTKGIRSWKDAQGFRYLDGTKFKAKLTDARIFHYGWAREETMMLQKTKEFEKLYHDDQNLKTQSFQYQKLYGLHLFKDTHPKYMKKWIEENRNDINIMEMAPYKVDLEILELKICDWLERVTGYRIGEFKNYRLVK